MDLCLLQALNGRAGWGNWTDYLAAFLDRGSLLIYAICLVIRWFWPSPRQGEERRTVLLTIISATAAVGLAQFPALFYYRPRPFLALPWVFDLMGTIPTTSLPSTYGAVSFAVALQLSWARPWWGLLLWPLTMAGEVARVYNGAHYPSDVLAGMLLGAFVALFHQLLKPKLEPALNRVLEMVGADVKHG